MGKSTAVPEEVVERDSMDLDIGDMSNMFGDMTEVAMTEGFESQGRTGEEDFDFESIEAGGESLDDMFGNYSPYAEKSYVPRYTREQARLEGVEYADTQVKPLEHIVIHGKSYTDMTPLFLETPTDILFSNDINKLKK